MLLRRKLSKLFFGIILCVIIAASGSGHPAAALAAQINPESIALTWADDTRTTQAITWQTPDLTLNQVQYIPAGVRSDFSLTAKKVTAQREYLPETGDTTAVYSVKLTDLKPGTRYFYRIGNGKAWNAVHSFQTAGAAVTQFKFLIFGDSQSDSYDTWRTTLHQAYKVHPDAVFFTNTGDLVNVGNDFSEWKKWFAASQGIVDTIPAMPLTGNHEMYTPQWKVNTPPALFTAQFQLPPNGPDTLKEQVYSFDYGNVHFVMLDSQEREEQLFIPDMLVKQQEWLEKDLSLTDKPWKVIFLHRPPYHSRSAMSNDKIREAFVPILDKYHADVVFSGHEHVYARTYPLYADTIASRTVQGTVYITTGRSGTKAHDRGEANLWHEILYNPADQPNYLSVQVSGDTMSVKVWKQNGELIDDWYINKPMPVRLDLAQ